jgi:hypothetical protein
MKRTSGLLVIMGMLIASAAVAGDRAAEAFLTDIYSHYRGDDRTAKGVDLSGPRDYDRYFTPELERLMSADEAAAAKQGDVPALDGDPFVDAQDWTITDIRIRVAETVRDRTTADVSFANFGKRETVRIDLRLTPKGWRIDDIHWPKGDGSLRGLYAKQR